MCFLCHCTFSKIELRKTKIIFTAHVQSTGELNVFKLFVHQGAEGDEGTGPRGKVRWEEITTDLWSQVLAERGRGGEGGRGMVRGGGEEEERWDWPLVPGPFQGGYPLKRVIGPLQNPISLGTPWSVIPGKCDGNNDCS